MHVLYKRCVASEWGSPSTWGCSPKFLRIHGGDIRLRLIRQSVQLQGKGCLDITLGPPGFLPAI